MVVTASTESKYSIKLPVFEGPLDLLLHLIRENKVDIYDIPIALITHQYLEHLEAMKELNLEIASEFIVMASTLIYIKSRMLLPVEQSEDPTLQEDPRENLVNRLLEYQAFKEASEKMRELEAIWTNIFCREVKDEPVSFEPELRLFDLNVFDMLTALKRVLSKLPDEVAVITKESLTLKDRMQYVVDRLTEQKTLRFEELFSDDKTKLQVIVTFLALLELMKLGLLKAYQEGLHGVIWIVKADEGPSNSLQTLENP